MLKRVKPLITLLAAALILCFLTSGVFAAGDTATATNLGTSAPPAALIAEYGFLSHENNGLEIGSIVSSIPMTYSSIGLQASAYTLAVNIGWTSNWSHGYTGHLYYTENDAITNTLTLPDHCLGAILYVESNYYFNPYDFTFTANGMATPIILEDVINNGGASGVAFLSNTDYMKSITINADPTSGGFAFGELYLSYGEILSFTDSAAAKDTKILDAFASILGVDKSRLTYSVTTPAGESAVYPAGGSYDITVTIDGSDARIFPKGLRVIQDNLTAPAAPVLTPAIDSITAESIFGAEYSLDGAVWQDSNVFSGLTPATPYTIYARYKATSTLPASPASSSATSTLFATPAAPILSSTANSVTAQVVSGCEYSLDGTVWQDSNVFSGLTAATPYTVHMRYKATAAIPASLSSSADVTTLFATPSAPVLSSTANSVTAQTSAGCEYSLNGTVWQDSNIFSGLTPATPYTVYMRVKATAVLPASSSSSSSVTTLFATPAAPVLSSTANSVIAQVLSGCEYSLNGTVWQDSNAFSGLNPATSYTVYMRYKATAVLAASTASSSLITTMAAPTATPTPTATPVAAVAGAVVSRTGETGGLMAAGVIVLAAGALLAGVLVIKKKRSI